MDSNYQNLVCLLGYLAHQPNHVVWIRTPDYRQQLYVSDSFQEVWGRDRSTLFEDPLRWTEFLVNDERTEKIFELCLRNPFSIDENVNTTYYRINNPKDGIRYIRDTCFIICDKKNKAIAIAGVAVNMPTDRWEAEVNRMEHNRFSETEAIAKALQEISGIKIPIHKNDGLPNYYIFLRTGENISLPNCEIQCLKLTLLGMSAKEIARVAKLSFRTVQGYQKTMRERLGCKTNGGLFKVIHPATLDVLLANTDD